MNVQTDAERLHTLFRRLAWHTTATKEEFAVLYKKHGYDALEAIIHEIESVPPWKPTRSRSSIG